MTITKKLRYAEWVDRYYPVEAELVAPEDSLDHSILKWEGVAAGWVDREGRHDVGRPPIELTGGSCALCVNYRAPDASKPCAKCPLAISRAGVPCDSTAPGEDHSPWHAWTNNHNPEPMLTALRQAKALEPATRTEEHRAEALRHTLLILGEEASEVAQAASKCIRFGLEDRFEGYRNRNIENLELELSDLQTLVEAVGLLRGRELTFGPTTAKWDRVQAMAKTSYERGQLSAGAFNLINKLEMK